MRKKKRCPECGSDEITVYEMTAFDLNTGKRLYTACKINDVSAYVSCNSCNWQGVLITLENN